MGERHPVVVLLDILIALSCVAVGIGIETGVFGLSSLEADVLIAMYAGLMWAVSYREFEKVRYGTDIVIGTAQFFWRFFGALLGCVADMWRDLIRDMTD